MRVRIVSGRPYFLAVRIPERRAIDMTKDHGFEPRRLRSREQVSSDRQMHSGPCLLRRLAEESLRQNRPITCSVKRLSWRKPIPLFSFSLTRTR